MQAILNRLVEKIESASIDPRPSDNIYMEDVFDQAIYQEILARLPKTDDYDFIDHPDAMLPDGTRTRKLMDVTDETLSRLNPADKAFWQQLRSVFTSTALQQAITRKFLQPILGLYQGKIPEMVTVPIFYRDFPGYYITPHTDAPFKIATMQFYFAKDHSQIHLGTSFHEKQTNGFSLLKTNQFKPNSAYAFVRTNNSWHSVQQLAKHESIRDSLALTVYLKGHEYISSRQDSSAGY
jgi:hypothetical protein